MSLTAYFGFFENSKLRKSEYCKVDVRCGTNFVQYIYNGVYIFVVKSNNVLYRKYHIN